MPTGLTYKDIVLYKTELCRNWVERGDCRYKDRCRYAHGPEELRPVARSNQYKTKLCKSYHESGSCLYGVRCTFIHRIVNDNQPVSNTITPVKEADTCPQKNASKIENEPITSSSNRNQIYAGDDNSNSYDIWRYKVGSTSVVPFPQPQKYQKQKELKFLSIKERKRIFSTQLQSSHSSCKGSLENSPHMAFNSNK